MAIDGFVKSGARMSRSRHRFISNAVRCSLGSGILDQLGRPRVVDLLAISGETHDIEPSGQDVCRSGFSLVEVCLAILVVGIGLLSVFSLFPSGLRSGEADTADTHMGLFAESVMNGLRANAMAITNSVDWDDNFKTELVRGVLASNSTPVNILDSSVTPSPVAWVFPAVANGEPLRYRLTIDAVGKSALLELWDGQYGSLSPTQSMYYTEFWYSGM